MVSNCSIKDFVFDGVPVPHFYPIELIVGVLNIKVPDEFKNGKFALYMDVSTLYYFLSFY